MGPSTRLTRIARTRRQIGLHNLFLLLAHRLINKIVTFDVLMVVVLDRDKLQFPKTPDEEHLAFKLMRASDFARVLESVDPDIRKRFQLETFDRDATPEDLLLVNYVDSTLAGFTFAHHGGEPTLCPGVQLNVPEGYVYNFSAFTHPTFRGRKHQGRRHFELLRRGECAGSRGLLGYVSYVNMESRKGLRKSGYTFIGLLYYIRAGKHTFVWSGRKLRKQGIRLHGARSFSTAVV
jgi:hypothetical protein